MKSQKITTALVIGFIVGIAIWTATHKSPFLTMILLVGSLLIGSRHSNNLKGIQAEISRREAVG